MFCVWTLTERPSQDVGDLDAAEPGAFRPQGCGIAEDLKSVSLLYRFPNNRTY